MTNIERVCFSSRLHYFKSAILTGLFTVTACIRRSLSAGCLGRSGSSVNTSRLCSVHHFIFIYLGLQLVVRGPTKTCSFNVSRGSIRGDRRRLSLSMVGLPLRLKALSSASLLRIIITRTCRDNWDHGMDDLCQPRAYCFRVNSVQSSAPQFSVLLVSRGKQFRWNTIESMKSLTALKAAIADTMTKVRVIFALLL